ncbi:MAG TPA: aspartyl protease family protein [Thermoanaerobaculia bacterium]|nr:aspartyl protease family protein [Thermoanaerobaculia bacterium]
MAISFLNPPKRLGLLGLALLFAASGLGSQEPAPPPKPCDGVRPASASIPLRYDERLVAAGFPSPAVRLTIGGRSAWFLVDSGAGVSTFAAWFVKNAGLSTVETATTMRDASGRAVPLRVVRGVAGTLPDGSTLKIEAAGIADFPPLFETNELGGLLSPQLLAPNGLAAVLDLRVPELRFEPFENALARLGATRVPEAKICEVAGADLANRLYAVPATVGGTSTILLLDSGATDSELQRDSAVARSLSDRTTSGGRTMGISGGEEKRLRAAGTAVGFAGRLRTLDVSIGAATSPCAPDGLLGIDALRSCALVLGAKEVGMVCDAVLGAGATRDP